MLNMIESSMQEIKKIRINFITASLGKGGAERVVSQLTNYFCDLGIKTRVIKLCYSDSVYQVNEDVEIVDFSGIEINNITDLLFKRALYLREYIINNSNESDIYISFQDYVSNIVCLAFIGLKNKLIVSERNDPAKSTILNKILKTCLYKRADGFVFQTRQAMQCFGKSVQRKSKIIFNPVSNDLIKIKYSVPNNMRICLAGRLTEQKNHVLALKSFKEVKKKYSDASIYIFGDGEKEIELKRFIKTNDLKDAYVLPFSNRIYDEICKSHIFILSSNFEGMPNVLMEAMSIGVPVISTDCRIGGPRELIGNNEFGILTKVNDANSMIQAIEKLANINEAQELSKKEKQRMKDFTIDKIALLWIEFIMKVYNGNI